MESLVQYIQYMKESVKCPGVYVSCFVLITCSREFVFPGFSFSYLVSLFLRKFFTLVCCICHLFWMR